MNPCHVPLCSCMNPHGNDSSGSSVPFFPAASASSCSAPLEMWLPFIIQFLFSGGKLSSPIPGGGFSLARRIRAGTELTWDYNYEVGSVEGKELLCCCGAIDCRGRLL